MDDVKQPRDGSLLKTFFFAEETPWGMALARMAVPLAVSIPLFYRFPRVRELFTTDGTPTTMFELYGHGPTLPILPPAIAVPLYGILLLCLLTTCVGFCTRLSLCIATPLYIYFNMLDGIGTMTKYSVIGSHLLLILTVSQAGLVWSVDALLKNRKAAVPQVMPPVAAVWPARLMQFLYCFLYFGAAVTKIQTAEFFSGEQMRYWMLSNWNYENPVGEAVAMWAWTLPVSAYVAVVWEILFAFLVYQRRTRWIALGMGVLFHFCTWLILGLYIFPTICLSGYVAFLMEEDILRAKRLSSRIRLNGLLRLPVRAVQRSVSALPSWNTPPEVVWLGILAVAAIAATETELQLDLYGTQVAAEGLPLPQLDATVARAMLYDQSALREKDKFFSFDLGTLMIGNQLANRRDVFTYGDQMIAQCNLNPPHEDLWVECLLQDEEQRTVEQFGGIVSREMLRYNFTYKVGNKLLPGRYSMVLKSGNKEIARRPFVVTGTPPREDFQSQMLTN